MDLLRICFNRAVQTLVFGGTRVLADIDQTFDDSFRVEYFGVAFIPVYLGSILFAGIFSNLYPKLPEIVVRFYDVFSDVKNLHSYGFHSVRYQNFSFLFLIALHSVTFTHLLFVSSKTIQLYDFRSLFASKKVYVGRDSTPFNISRPFTGIPILIVLALVLQSALAPSFVADAGNRYDWAGPIAMVIYSFCQCFILLTMQIFNRYVVVSLQAQYAKF